MTGLGWAELLMLLVCIGFFFLSPVAVALIFFATQRARTAPASITSPAVYRPPAEADGATSSAEVFARLTQRFCPQCRSPLATDAPEGLCPACLLAGGLTSSPRNA